MIGGYLSIAKYGSIQQRPHMLLFNYDRNAAWRHQKLIFFPHKPTGFRELLNGFILMQNYTVSKPLGAFSEIVEPYLQRCVFGEYSPLGSSEYHSILAWLYCENIGFKLFYTCNDLKLKSKNTACLSCLLKEPSP